MRNKIVSLWAIALVSLLFVNAIPTVTADPPPNWDTVYGVDGVFPEHAVPLWTRSSSGNKWSRTITFGDDILNFTRTDGLSTVSLDQYARSDSFDRSLGWQIEVRAKNIAGDSCILSLYNGDGGETKIQWDASASTVIVAGTSIGSGDSYTISDEYNIIRMVGQESTTSVVKTEIHINGTVVATYPVWWKSAPTHIKFGCGVATTNDGYFELDYVAYDLDSKTGTQREIEDLEDRIDELERRIAELENKLADIRPVDVNDTDLPYVPHDTKGRGSTDDNMVWLDPFRSVVYTIYASPASGSSIALYSPIPGSAEEHVCLQDDLFIGGSYSRLWLNDSVAGSEILNTTSQLSHYNLQYCYNATAETSGGDITVTRIVDVRLVDSFAWGENLQDGYFAVTSKIENTLAYNQECVRIYWAFPEEDSQGRNIQIDGASIKVQDMDSSLYLSAGRHFEASEVGGVSLELRYLNRSLSRTFRIEFTRASQVETTEYVVITDTEIAIADTYSGSPYTATVHISQSGTASFEGTIIVKFLLNSRYNGEQIDVNTLIIKRSDQSGSSEFWYDSVSNELRLTDVSMDEDTSVTWTLYWDWVGPMTPVVALLVAEPLVVYSLILLTGFLGMLTFIDERNKKSWKKWAGLVGIVAAIIAVLLLASGMGG